MNTLETRIKLWNHLATTGKLDLSEAWYASSEQKEIWKEIAAAERAEAQSNASRELRSIQELLAKKEVRKQFKDRIVILSDLGSGTGDKANDLIDLLPNTLVYYAPFDSSGELLKTCVRNTPRDSQKTGTRTTREDFVLHRENHSTEFASNVRKGNIGECISYLRKFHGYAKAIDRAAKEPGIRTHLRIHRDYKAIFRNLTLAAGAAFTKAATLDEQLRALAANSRVSTGSELRSKLYSLFGTYNSEGLKSVQAKIDEIPRFNKDKGYATSCTACRALEHTVEQILDIGLLRKGAPDWSDVERMEEGLLDEYRQDEFGIQYADSNEFVPKETLKCTYVRRGPGIAGSFSKNKLEELVIIRQHLRDPYLFAIPGGRDFAQEFATQPSVGLVLLLGQTLGNFTPPQQRKLMKNIYDSMLSDDALFIGVDLRPEDGDPRYAEKIEGIVSRYRNPTADKFLRQTTKLIGIPDDAIQFDARYRDNAVEMFYTVKRDFTVSHPESTSRPGLVVPSGSELLTGKSHKFSSSEMHKLLDTTGFTINYWIDNGYAVILARK